MQGRQTSSSKKNPANQQDEKNNCIRFTIHKIYKKGWGGPGRPAPGPPDLGRASGPACLTGRDQDPRLLGPFWPPGPRRLTSSLTFEVGPAARSPRSAGTPQGRPARSARHRTASLPPSGRGGGTQSGHWVPEAAGTQAPPLEAKARCLRRLLVLGEGTEA